MTSNAAAPVELVPSEGAPTSPLPPALRERVHVLTLHDGALIPDVVRRSPGVRALVAEGALRGAIDEVRDWGADLVAGYLASALGLAGHRRVTTARAVVDFNRFPGITQPGAPHLGRLALGGPLAEAMDDDARRAVLTEHYDRISSEIDATIDGAMLVLSIHTYDEHNATTTRRPAVSLLSRSDSYQVHSRLPYGLFDPLFPDVLVESSAGPVLRDRLGLTLERAGLAIEHNYPYCLPDGSLEIRSQPWFFFHQLRRAFEASAPETAEDPAYGDVWEMLFNTNLRQADASALSRYIHRYCAAPSGREAEFEAARDAYGRIRDFLRADPSFVERYRRSTERTSALTIEVRKDLVWRFERGAPAGPIDDSARRIAGLLATGVAKFLCEDLPALRSAGDAPLG